jgi:IS30 family transposase
MAAQISFKHLTLEDRLTIVQGIKLGLSKVDIAKKLGKDPSTIAKEIKKNREQVSFTKLPLECTAYRKCKYGRYCKPGCPGYIPFKCKRRDRSPGACNGCSRRNVCHFNKYEYDPNVAYSRYRIKLVDCRRGLNLDEEERKRLAEIVVKPLKRGQSPYAVVKNNPGLGICEKTLYNYVAANVFRLEGLSNIDLRQKVKRRIPPKYPDARYKKRVNRQYLEGRTYDDYLDYCEQVEVVRVVQMDTVHSSYQGPVLQTFLFLPFNFFYAIWHESNTSSNMVKGIDILQEILGPELFAKYANILLADRGSEFSDALGIEGTPLRTHLFYCDAMSPQQKGALEKRHALFRFIVPKEKSFQEIGLTGQDATNKILSHLNSYPLEACQGKTPWQVLAFLAPELAKRFQEAGLEIVDPNQVVLKRNLLR